MCVYIYRMLKSSCSKLKLTHFAFFDKIDHPFCLQQCFFLLATYIFCSKFAKQIWSRPSTGYMPHQLHELGLYWLYTKAAHITRISYWNPSMPMVSFFCHRRTFVGKNTDVEHEYETSIFCPVADVKGYMNDSPWKWLLSHPCLGESDWGGTLT